MFFKNKTNTNCYEGALQKCKNIVNSLKLQKYCEQCKTAKIL